MDRTSQLLNILNSRCRGSEMGTDLIVVSQSDNHLKAWLKVASAEVVASNSSVEMNLDKVQIRFTGGDCFINQARVPPFFCEKPWVDPMLSLRIIQDTFFGFKLDSSNLLNQAKNIQSGQSGGDVCIATFDSDDQGSKADLKWVRLKSPRESKISKSFTDRFQVNVLNLNHAIYQMYGSSVLGGVSLSGGFFFWTLFKRVTDEKKNAQSSDAMNQDNSSQNHNLEIPDGDTVTTDTGTTAGGGQKRGEIYNDLSNRTLRLVPVGYVASSTSNPKDDKIFMLEQQSAEATE